jgi:hypothetical protein
MAQVAVIGGLVVLILLLALFGSLFIAASAYIWQVSQRSLLGAEDRYKRAWAQFGAVMLGTVGAIALLTIPLLIWRATNESKASSLSSSRTRVTDQAILAM